MMTTNKEHKFKKLLEYSSFRACVLEITFNILFILVFFLFLWQQSKDKKENGK